MEERRSAFAALREVLEASGAVKGEAAERLQRVATLFRLGSEPPVSITAGKTVRNRKAS